MAARFGKLGTTGALVRGLQSSWDLASARLEDSYKSFRLVAKSVSETAIDLFGI
jgi:hypothetical protein